MEITNEFYNEIVEDVKTNLNKFNRYKVEEIKSDDNCKFIKSITIIIDGTFNEKVNDQSPFYKAMLNCDSYHFTSLNDGKMKLMILFLIKD